MSPTLLHSVVRVADARTPDADLLDRFRRNRDERAFEELVRRHGPLVWAVCRHMLVHHADAEDAFQAVFLALVRSASSIRAGQALPGWLHGVAVRVAIKARRSAVRRRQRELKAAIPERDRPVPDESWTALMHVVHDEIGQLPEAERTAFVLCDLEGVRQPDAAARLGWPLGTLSGRLCKARQRLLDQLTRRGIAPAVLALGGLAGSAGTVPASLFERVNSFPTASADGVPSTVANLARGLVEGTTMRTKMLAATILVAGALGMSSGGLGLSQTDAQSGGGSGVGPPTGASSGGGFAPRNAQGAANNPFGPAGGPGGFGGDGGAGAVFGGQSGGGAGMMGFAGGAPAWDYKFVDLRSDDRDAFTKAISDAGRDGWEFGGSERLRRGNEQQLVLVFKKPHGSRAMFSGGGMGGMAAPGGGVGGGMSMPGFGGNLSGAMSGPSGMEMPGLGGTGARLTGGDVEARTHRLKSANATDVAKAIEKALPKAKTLKVVPEPTSNMIIIVADTATMKEVLRIIEEHDGRSTPGGGGPGGRGTSGGTGAGGSGGGPPPAGLGGGSGRPGVASRGLGGGGVGLSRPAPGGPGGLGPIGEGAARRAPAELKVFVLKHAKAQELVPVLERLFRTAELTAEARSNQLIVRADDETLAEVAKLLEKLDVELPRR